MAAGTTNAGLISCDIWLAGALPVSPVATLLVPSNADPGPAVGAVAGANHAAQDADSPQVACEATGINIMQDWDICLRQIPG